MLESMPGSLVRNIVDWESRPEFQGLVGSWSVEEHLRAMESPDNRYLLVRDGEGEPSGFVLLRGVTSPDRSIELKRIVMSAPNRGMGRRALEGTLAFAFDELQAHRVWLDVFDYNERARHLYRSVGFREDGVLRESVFRDGAFHTLILMSMLEREFRARAEA